MSASLPPPHEIQRRNRRTRRTTPVSLCRFCVFYVDRRARSVSEKEEHAPSRPASSAKSGHYSKINARGARLLGARSPLFGRAPGRRDRGRALNQAFRRRFSGFGWTREPWSSARAPRRAARLAAPSARSAGTAAPSRSSRTTARTGADRPAATDRSRDTRRWRG
jgi:hypothetical protein